MAQFAAGAEGMYAAGKAAASAAKGMTISAQKMAAQGFDIGTEILKASPADFKKHASEMLDKAAGSGDGLIANTIRVTASYERFHYQLMERLHPTDNLVNATSKQIFNMFKELTDKVKIYFCSFFKQLYAENGEQLRFLIIKTIQKMSQQPIMIKDYLEPSIKMVILNVLSDNHTKTEIMNLLRGDCLQPEKLPEEPIQIVTGGNMASAMVQKAKNLTNTAKTAAKNKINDIKQKASSTSAMDVADKASSMADKASSMTKSIPSSSSSFPSQGTGPVPLVEISYLDTPDRLKSFICDSFQRMFTDRTLSIKGLVLTNLETLVQNSEEIKKRNVDIIIKIIDEMFDNPLTKEEFIHHLSGGCSVPRKPPLYIHADKELTPEEQKKKEMQGERDPFFMMKKLSSRKFPIALGGKSSRNSKKNPRKNTYIYHHKTRKLTKK